jgi:N-acetylmuramoyl-L-alanine amidase
MKKILSAYLFVGFILLFSAGLLLNAQAASGMEKTVSGSVSKLAYNQSGSTEEIRIYTSKTTILRNFVLEPNSDCKNYRIGIEIADAVIHQNGAFDVNQGSVYQIRYANKKDPQAASIVIETTKKPDYTITPSGDGKYLSVVLKGGVSNQPSPSPAPSPTPEPTTNQTVPVTNNTGSTSVGAVTKNGAISLSIQGDTCLVKFEGINLNSPFGSTGKVPSVELRQKERILQITLPGKDNRINDGIITGNNVVYGILVNYNQKLNSTIIRIVYDDAITYTQEVSGGSTVLKIKNSSTGISGSTGNTGSTGGTSTPSPSPSPSPAPSPTPAPSSDSEPSRGGSSDRGGTVNIQAGDGDDVVLRITGANIVGKYRQYADEIITENDAARNSYAFMFPAELIDLGQGSINVNSAVVSTVTTLTTPSNSFLQLHKKDASKGFSIVEGSSANELLVVARSLAEDSPSTSVSNPSSKAKGKLIVLDAGHGGSDPGAEFSGLLEKTFNLDITLKTEAILKQKGINVKLTRSNDVFVGLEERAELANKWGADLFISIHNNSMPAGMKGSMSFYYPTSYKGKTYAKIILDDLYNKLNMGAMGSNGLKGADYVVLRKTKMPAVLVEVACMSHPDDLNLLRSEAFRQRVAESLADSIIKILNQM